MDELTDRVFEAYLRQRVGQFLDRRTRWKRPLIGFLDSIRRHTDDIVLFGGLLRDLMWPQYFQQPRDVDLVVLGLTVHDLETICADFIERKTRFGGLRLDVKGWSIDIWPLQDTWGIQKQNLPFNFRNLPKSTFLNIEAIATSLWPKQGGGREVFESGFFDALHSRTLELNYRDNPFPELCVVRALIIAAKLDFHLSKDLVQYIVSKGNALSSAEFQEIQIGHYGRLLCKPMELSNWISCLEFDLSQQKRKFRLPVPRERQLNLWKS